jgi:hypothetical protein
MLTRRTFFAGGLSSGAAAGLVPALRAAATETVLTPETYGAVGDGRTDDTSAFLRLSAALQTKGGGVVELRPGATYLFGRQLPSSSQFLVGTPALSVSNVERLVVRMRGATLKFRSGLKFGSFNPDGNPRDVRRLPHFDWAARADIGHAIDVKNVGYVSVSGGRIDCNSRGAVIGGLWGDAGRQCAHAGIVSYGCGRVECSDLEIVDSCLDGIVLGFIGLTGRDPVKPFLLRHVTIRRVGRNCVSVVGTNSTLIEDCTFEHAGMAPLAGSKTLNSAPASCLDVEAEAAECRNVIIRRSKLISGSGTGAAFVADSGPSRDITIEDCLLVGAVWTSKPGTRIAKCTIYGYFAKLAGGQPNPADNTLVTDCTLFDVGAAYGYATSYPLAIDLTDAGPGVKFVRTKIAVSRSRLNLRNGILNGVSITFATGTDRIKNRDYGLLMEGASLTDVTIEERIPAAKRPADAFYIAPPRSALRTSLVSREAKLLWSNWSRAAGGHSGKP